MAHNLDPSMYSPEFGTAAKLTEWENEPTVLLLKEELDIAKQSHDDHVSQVKSWLDLRKKGPAGGWLFYDKGYFSEGWRYLECAPSDFEYESSWGDNLLKIRSLDTAIGAGKNNTKEILKKDMQKVTVNITKQVF